MIKKEFKGTFAVEAKEEPKLIEEEKKLERKKEDNEANLVRLIRRKEANKKLIKNRFAILFVSFGAKNHSTP